MIVFQLGIYIYIILHIIYYYLHIWHIIYYDIYYIILYYIILYYISARKRRRSFLRDMRVVLEVDDLCHFGSSRPSGFWDLSPLAHYQGGWCKDGTLKCSCKGWHDPCPRHQPENDRLPVGGWWHYWCPEEAWWTVYSQCHSTWWGSSISFLKRKLVRLPCGLALVPGTDVNKVIQMFEQSFRRARLQTIPCTTNLDGGPIESTLQWRSSTSDQWSYAALSCAR